jgi:metacaspase-1
MASLAAACFPSFLPADDQRDPFRLPTKENIRMAMHWLVQGCSYGDSLVFHFSGIGAQVADDDGDEADGYDEAICPLDAFQSGPILDDEINEVIVRPLVHGARLHAVVDACYSATVLDLPYQCRMSRNGFWQWEDESPPSGAWKGTSGGHAVLISGYSEGKGNFAMVRDMIHTYILLIELCCLASIYIPNMHMLLLGRRAACRCPTPTRRSSGP